MMWGMAMRPLRNFVFPFIPTFSKVRPGTTLAPSITIITMAIPSVQQLERPQPLHEVIAKDKPEDCLPCRVTGE